MLIHHNGRFKLMIHNTKIKMAGKTLLGKKIAIRTIKICSMDENSNNFDIFDFRIEQHGVTNPNSYNVRKSPSDGIFNVILDDDLKVRGMGSNGVCMNMHMAVIYNNDNSKIYYGGNFDLSEIIPNSITTNTKFLYTTFMTSNANNYFKIVIEIIVGYQHQSHQTNIDPELQTILIEADKNEKEKCKKNLLHRNMSILQDSIGKINDENLAKSIESIYYILAKMNNY